MGRYMTCSKSNSLTFYASVSSISNDATSTKIVELSKRIRELTSELAAEKNKVRQQAFKFNELQKKVGIQASVCRRAFVRVFARACTHIQARVFMYLHMRVYAYSQASVCRRACTIGVVIRALVRVCRRACTRVQARVFMYVHGRVYMHV